MQGLREGANRWKITCSYDEHNRTHKDKLVVSVSTLDPLRSFQDVLCPEVESVRIKGQGCDNCVVGTAKVFHFLYIKSSVIWRFSVSLE